jgi:hypothetical protein
MRPDYPNKTFPDKRISYTLLIQSLAMDNGFIPLSLR